MSRVVRGGLIQATLCEPATSPVAAVKKAMIDKHVALIAEAAEQGAQIVCLQELFYGPYFCAEQQTRVVRADRARARRSHDQTVMAELAKKHEIVLDRAGVRRGSDRRLLQHGRRDRCRRPLSRQVPEDAHPACAPGFWEKFYFRPGNLGYPVSRHAFGKVGVYICYDRHFPEGARCLGLNGAEIVFNPSATVAGLSRISLEAGTAGACRRQRLFRRSDQSSRL